MRHGNLLNFPWRPPRVIDPMAAILVEDRYVLYILCFHILVIREVLPWIPPRRQGG